MKEKNELNQYIYLMKYIEKEFKDIENNWETDCNLFFPSGEMEFIITCDEYPSSNEIRLTFLVSKNFVVTNIALTISNKIRINICSNKKDQLFVGEAILIMKDRIAEIEFF